MKLPIQLIIALVFLTQSAWANQKMAEFNYSPGFEAYPIGMTVSIFQDGLVSATTVDYRKNETKTFEVARLSEKALKGLQTKIDNISVAEIVDPKAEEPKCSDTPYIDWKVFKQGAELPIRATGGCHVSEFPKYPNKGYARQVVRILDGLAELIKR